MLVDMVCAGNGVSRDQCPGNHVPQQPGSGCHTCGTGDGGAAYRTMLNTRPMGTTRTSHRARGMLLGGRNPLAQAPLGTGDLPSSARASHSCVFECECPHHRTLSRRTTRTKDPSRHSLGTHGDVTSPYKKCSQRAF